MLFCHRDNIFSREIPIAQFKPKMDSRPSLATLNQLIFQSCPFQLCMFNNETCGRAALQGWAVSYECFLPVAGGWLTLFLSLSSADVSWQQEVLPFQPALNESKPAWGWEDEQGFSALRHSGRTTAPRAPTSLPLTCPTLACSILLWHQLH